MEEVASIEIAFPNPILQDAPEVELEPLLQAEGNGNERLRVLIVEDDPIQQNILREYLSSIRLKVSVAGSISEAEVKLENEKIDIAILDIHLPDGDGLRLCQKIDESPNTAGIPIIMLSSEASDDLVRRTRASGGCFFIGKPYDPNVLLAIIERALGSELQ